MTTRTKTRARKLAIFGATSLTATLVLSLAATANAQSQEPADAANDDVEILAIDSPDIVKGSYIASFDDSAPENEQKITRLAEELENNHNINVDHVYHSSLQGFSFTASEAVANEIAGLDGIEFVEAVQEFTLNDTTQASPPNWGIDRLDQQNLPLNSSYSYSDSAGAGVTVYVLDTGIRPSHNEFGGRATMGPSFAGEDDSTDCHGHGTHVAGTVVGSQYGVAKSANVVGVQVLGCNGRGTTDGIIAAIDWVSSSGARPAVINMSLGGASDGTDQAYYDAVASAVANGVTVVAAAGNDGDNACNYAPARFNNVITVGNSNRTDARYTGVGTSNYGTCVDLFGPGTDISSAVHNNDTGVVAFTGTSMASPHVAGMAALYLADNPNATPEQTTNAILNNATPDVLSNVGTGSPNLLSNIEFMLDGGNNDGGDNPGTGACADYPTVESGSLNGAGATVVHPSGSYYYAAGTQTHSACLSGPSGTDFDLYLQKWSGSRWSNVSSSTTASSEESISYSGSSGYYRWSAYSYSGSGTYTIGYTK